MRVENGHAHALTRYQSIGFHDYLNLFLNCLETKISLYQSLNVHLPFEIQHPIQYPNLKNGLSFIYFGELLKHLFKINLYWENAPEENIGSWDLKNGQTEWRYIPYNIEICLDIGHFALGCKSVSEVKNKTDTLLKVRGDQIKHLHIHINNFKSDQHINDPRKIELKFTKKWIDKIKRNKTFIYEKGD